ncbi:hypothetical protein KKE60_05745 [Patescibacteria group bacterium]|nr:hypothetical protein [Patescibacteria group bacterium]
MSKHNLIAWGIGVAAGLAIVGLIVVCAFVVVYGDDIRLGWDGTYLEWTDPSSNVMMYLADGIED